MGSVTDVMSAEFFVFDDLPSNNFCASTMLYTGVHMAEVSKGTGDTRAGNVESAVRGERLEYTAREEQER